MVVSLKHMIIYFLRSNATYDSLYKVIVCSAYFMDTEYTKYTIWTYIEISISHNFLKKKSPFRFANIIENCINVDTHQTDPTWLNFIFRKIF